LQHWLGTRQQDKPQSHLITAVKLKSTLCRAA
jgi:hypothetical protein